MYQYCQANPVGYVDPSGHNICPTQLSLYKKYKEFFTKKMPESEAKKKAYEYMRKKMGLTADNPFTEASEGGTKSAYNDRGNTVKNWKGQNAAGAYQSATEKGNSKSGTPSSKIDYKEVFFKEHPELRGEVWVHHGVEQQVLTKPQTKGLFSYEEMHSLDNLRGIPKEINSDLHLSKIRKEWNKFYKEFPNPTKEQLLQKRLDIDKKYGHLFKPPIDVE